jgi:hypothetical protein
MASIAKVQRDLDPLLRLSVEDRRVGPATVVPASDNTLGVTRRPLPRPCHAASEKGSLGRAWKSLR